MRAFKLLTQVNNINVHYHFLKLYSIILKTILHFTIYMFFFVWFRVSPSIDLYTFLMILYRDNSIDQRVKAVIYGRRAHIQTLFTFTG